MGLSLDSTRFLLETRKSGVCFDQVLTLGRQHMMLGPDRLEALLREYNLWPTSDESALRYSLKSNPWRSEVLLRALGAQEITACDASDYEGASLVHDLNQPIPPSWEEKYDIVLDGGTFEHVFNFPVAIANAMKMVKTGGHLLIFTPTNNYCGHGFYQFSPELLYRVLSTENGYQVLRMVALADSIGQATMFGVKYPFHITGPWHAVSDPAVIQKRVELINDKPTMLMILAKRISRENIFAKTPQQSDYVPQWQEGANTHIPGQPKRNVGLEARLRGIFSETFCREKLPRLALILDPFRLARFRRKHSFHNHEFFRRIGK